jgi:hypothetical protein
VRSFVIPIPASLLFQPQDMSLLLEHATPPSRPVNTLATGISVVEVEVEARTHSMQTRRLNGNSPFVTPGLNALMRWGLAVALGVASARTSVTFLYRSPNIFGSHPAIGSKTLGRLAEYFSTAAGNRRSRLSAHGGCGRNPDRRIKNWS